MGKITEIKTSTQQENKNGPKNYLKEQTSCFTKISFILSYTRTLKPVSNILACSVIFTRRTIAWIN
jgi:hypothetical protein